MISVNNIKTFLKDALTRDPRTNKMLIISIASGILILLAMILRWKLTPFSNDDYVYFLSPWYDHLRENGIMGFGDNFANYNFPYLFLLYLTTLLPIAKIIAFKLIAIGFDFILSYVVYLLIHNITKSKVRAILSGLAVLFLPTVFINSSLWGQSDVIYVTFLLISLYFVLIKRYTLVWVFFGIALAFKLQAIFFLPVLVYVWMKKKGDWRSPLIAVPTFLVLSLPPVLFGRSLVDTMSVYLNQYDAQPLLAVSAPNIYFWLPQNLSSMLNGPALIFAAAIIGLSLLAIVLKVKYTKSNLLFISAFFLLLVPFVLPQMHERYFYGFEVLCLILVAIDPRKIWIIFLSQFITLCAYVPFLFQQTIVPWHVLSIIMSVMMFYFTYWLMQLLTGFNINSLIMVSRTKK